MREPVKKLLFWAPRVMSILLAAFVSLFALDVFGEGYGLWGTVVALFMHLVPTYLIVIALIIAWRREWIGGILFIGLGLLYIVLLWNPEMWLSYLMLSGPAFLVGILFLINWRYREDLRGGSSA